MFLKRKKTIIGIALLLIAGIIVFRYYTSEKFKIKTIDKTYNTFSYEEDKKSFNMENISNVIFAIYSDSYDDKADKKYFDVGDISSTVLAISSIVNIILVITFFSKDRHYRAEERKKDNRIYWFRKVILENNINNIEVFFRENISIIELFEDLYFDKAKLTEHEYDNSIKCLFGMYIEQKTKINHNFIDIIYSADKGLGQAISELFTRFQDEFTDYVYKLSIDSKGYNVSNLKNIVYIQKKMLLSMLYKFGLDDCCYNK